MKIINKAKLTKKEFIELYATIGYQAALSFNQNLADLSIEEIEKNYYLQPTLDKALLLQSLTMTGWIKEKE